MNHLHKREFLEEGDIVIVNCDYKCNVMITTDSEYRNYQAGRPFRYHGGAYDRFPVRILVPSTDHWNVTLDLGGGSATVRHSITFIRHT